MRRNKVIEIIKAHQEELRSMGVQSIDLFGSVARDEATSESDVDFMIELNRQIGLFDFVGIKLYLEDILGRDVDLGSLDALRESLREPVMKDSIRVF